MLKRLNLLSELGHSAREDAVQSERNKTSAADFALAYPPGQANFHELFLIRAHSRNLS